MRALEVPGLELSLPALPEGTVGPHAEYDDDDRRHDGSAAHGRCGQVNLEDVEAAGFVRVDPRAVGVDQGRLISRFALAFGTFVAHAECKECTLASWETGLSSQLFSSLRNDTRLAGLKKSR